MNTSSDATETDIDDLPLVAVNLLKSVIYQDTDARLWGRMLSVQARLRDYMAVLGLDVILDEAEGYAFLRSREPEDAEAESTMPRLIARRPLSFRVSLLLALLRRKLAEADAGGGSTRLVLSREQIVETVRVFLPDASNEAKLIDHIESDLKKIADLGFVRRLKPPSGRAAAGPTMYEVRRILKAFVDAQWLADFDARLADYQAHLSDADNRDD